MSLPRVFSHLPPPGAEILEGTPVNLWYDATYGFLVDSGYEGGEEWWNEVPRLRWILLTHHHPDHSGNLEALLRRFPRATLVVPSPEKLPPPLRSRALVASDGKFYGALQALHTPGHTGDHFVYYDPRRECLYSGDLVLGTGTPWVGPPEGDMALYLRSLQRLLPLPLRSLYPGHGPKTSRHQLLWTLKHRLNRLKEIALELKRMPGATPLDLVRRIYTEKEGMALSGMHELAALMTMQGYLDYLEGKGRILKREGRYYPAGTG